MFVICTLFLLQLYQLNRQPINLRREKHIEIINDTVIHDQNVQDEGCQANQDINGGLYLIKSPAVSVNFTNCIFSNCFNNYYTFDQKTYGGVLYFSNIDNTHILNTTFVNCSAPNGGAVALSKVRLSIFEDSTFSHDRAYVFMFIELNGNGGAVHIDNPTGCSSIFKNCVFDSNQGQYGGAIYTQPDLEELVVDGCTFCNNHNDVYAGSAIYAGEETYTTPVKSVSISSTVFVNNSSPKSGGVCFIRADEFTCKSCNFTQNQVKSVTNCPLLYITIRLSSQIIFDTCSVIGNSASLVHISSEFLDNITFTHCNVSNNYFYSIGLIDGDPLPRNLTFEHSVFVSNNGASNGCHAISIPKGNKRFNTIVNCVIDGTGIKNPGPSVLIKSTTEISGTSFINHKGSALTLEVSAANLSVKSITFLNNECTDARAGPDGVVADEGGVFSFIDTNVSTSLVLKSAALVIFENSWISRVGMNITSTNITLVNTVVTSLPSLNFTAANTLFIQNVSCYDNTKNYFELAGVDNTSHILITDSRFRYTPLRISHAGSFSIANVQFAQCNGNANGGALSIGSIVSARVASCTFNECEPSNPSSNGGALFVTGVSDFRLESTVFDGCASSGSGSSLYLVSGLNSVVYNCTFHNANKYESPSVLLADASSACKTAFKSCCFSSGAKRRRNAGIYHILFMSSGDVSFDAACFDRSKDESVAFEGKQYEINPAYFNCFDCDNLPTEEPTPSLPPTQQPSVEPVSSMYSSSSQSSVEPTAEPTESDGDDDDDSTGKKKLNTTAIVGIVVGCVAAIIIIIVIIVVVVKRKKNNQGEELDPSNLIQPNTPLVLNTQNND